MTVSTAATLIHRIYEIINNGELDRLEEVFEPDYADHGEGSVGLEPFRHQIAAFRSAFPDLRVTVDQMIADGEFVASCTTFTGTHTEPLLGMPATGRPIEVNNVDFAWISNAGRVAERWGGLNMFSLLTQLGAIPAPS